MESKFFILSHDRMLTMHGKIKKHFKHFCLGLYNIIVLGVMVGGIDEEELGGVSGIFMMDSL